MEYQHPLYDSINHFNLIKLKIKMVDYCTQDSVTLEPFDTNNYIYDVK